eukprot:6579291-Alexandrium_andersonii.AAC.1
MRRWAAGARLIHFGLTCSSLSSAGGQASLSSRGGGFTHAVLGAAVGIGPTVARPPLLALRSGA